MTAGGPAMECDTQQTPNAWQTDRQCQVKIVLTPALVGWCQGLSSATNLTICIQFEDHKVTPKVPKRWTMSTSKVTPKYSQSDPRTLPNWAHNTPKNDPKLALKWSSEYHQCNSGKLPKWFSQYLWSDPRVPSEVISYFHQSNHRSISKDLVNRTLYLD